MSDLIAKLNKALKPKGNSSQQGNFRHENEAAILEAAKNLLVTSEVGQELLEFAAENGVSIHVLRNKQDFGVLPDEKAVFVSCPAGVDMPTARVVIRLAGALREAMQELKGLYTRPKTSKIGKDRFIQQQTEQQKNMLFWQTAVVHEIYEATGLSQIVDEFAAMGYSDLYEAYKKDLEEASG